MVEQCRQRRGYHGTDARSGQLGLVVAVLQVCVHRKAGEDGVVQRPRTRCLAQQQIGPGPYAQCCQSCIDAIGIRLQCGALTAGGDIQAGLHARAQAMHAVALVQAHGLGAKQLGQLAGRCAAHQIHLEIAFLRMHVAERTHRIELVCCIDGDHAQPVALHADRRSQAAERAVAVQLRQAAAHQQIQPQAGRQDQQPDSQQQPAQPLTHCRFLGAR